MTSSIRIHPFNLKKTLECGQFFRFTKVIDTYIVQTSGRIFSLSQRGEALFYEGVEEAFLRQFFRLDEDLDKILKEVDRDPVIHQAIRLHRGMRLIRQDPWECLLSFICSSAKSIAHIRTMVELLCKSSGEKVVQGCHVSYAFPKPQSIKQAFQLESVRAGFRRDYLRKAIQHVDPVQLLSLKSLSYPEARKRVMGLSGVGKKIADCVLLYSLDFLEAFPIDTWIRRGLEKVYFHGKKVGERRMEEFVRNHFGPYAGYAQLYLYHFWRSGSGVL